MDFGEALQVLKKEGKVLRKGWNGKGMYLYKGECRLPVEPFPIEVEEGWIHPFGFSEFIIMKTADNKLIPWLASQTDILAEDWEILND